VEIWNTVLAPGGKPTSISNGGRAYEMGRTRRTSYSGPVESGAREDENTHATFSCN